MKRRRKSMRFGIIERNSFDKSTNESTNIENKLDFK